MSTAAQDTAAKPVFSPIVAISMVAVGALSLLFYIVFAAYAPDLNGDSDGRTNVMSRSAIGFAGLAAFLKEQGIPVLISRGLGEAELSEASLIIETPGLENDTAEVNAVTHQGPKLVILPKWFALPDPIHPGWVRNGGIEPADSLAKSLLESPSKSSTLARREATAPARLRYAVNRSELTTGPIERLQTIGGSDWTAEITDQSNPAQAGIILARLSDSNTYILSDPDLMNTHGLKDLATARAAIAIIRNLRAGDGPVVFDLTLAGYRRSPNFLRLLFEPPLLGATLCALLAALLMGVHAAVRFGAPVAAGRAFALGKQALADNSAALIAMARRTHRIAPRYAATMRRRVARAVGAPADARDEVLNELLEKLRTRDAKAPPLGEMFTEAAGAEDDADALRVARKLYRWRREIIHER